MVKINFEEMVDCCIKQQVCHDEALKILRYFFGDRLLFEYMEMMTKKAELLISKEWEEYVYKAQMEVARSIMAGYKFEE